MKIPLVDLKIQYSSIKKEVSEAIQRVIEGGEFILGPEVEALEEEIATYCGAKYAVGVASGTDALFLSLRASDIRPADEVIVPAYTFFATAEVISLLGATPVFVDIDPKTYCLDVNQIEERVTEKTRAIIPVHLFGHPTNMGPVLELARRENLKVIEDNAQAFGAEYEGRKTGSIGDIGCLSFFPSKNLGGYGDGGMVITNDARVAETVRMLRTHGWKRKYYPQMIGHNSRLDELQAAILRVKLRHLDRWNEQRRQVAAKYHQLLGECGVAIPEEATYAKHVYHLYVIGTPQRNELQNHLKSKGIGSGIYYPLPLHLLEPYKHPVYSQDTYPQAEKAASETLAIPIYPEMTQEQVEAVVTAVRQGISYAEPV